MYENVNDLNKRFFIEYKNIYESKNLIVKLIGCEICIFYQHYILVFYNRDDFSKQVTIFNMNDEFPSEKVILFKDNKLSLVSFYLDYQKGEVLQTSEDKMKKSFSKIKQLMVFS